MRPFQFSVVNRIVVASFLNWCFIDFVIPGELGFLRFLREGFEFRRCSPQGQHSVGQV